MGGMLSILASLVAESTVDLPVPPFVYGLISLAIFAMMLGVLFAFRQASAKIPTPHNTVSHGDDDEHEPTAGDHR